MKDEPELVEGRVRRSRMGIVALVAVSAIVVVSLGSRLFEEQGDEQGGERGPGLPSSSPSASVRAPGLHGRIVYATFETRGSVERQQRLWVLDLQTNALTEGPLVPPVEELSVADPRRGSLVVVTSDARAQGVAYLLDDLSADAEPAEVVRADVVSVNSGRAELVVGRSELFDGDIAGCQGHRIRLSRIALPSGDETLLSAQRLACGNLVSAAGWRELVVYSVVADGEVELLVPMPGRPRLLYEGYAVVSISPAGALLLADAEEEPLRGLGVWPRTPTGPLLLWGPETPRPLVRGVRLFGQRVLAWSPRGDRVIVNGIVRDERGMWLVDVTERTGGLLLPPNSFPLRSAFSGATFDADGNAYGGAPGIIVVATADGIRRLSLPPDAPTPVGPIAWLP